MSIYKSAKGLTRNPLGIIGLFVVLVYGIAGLVLGVAASSLSETQKWPMVVFLVLFPVVILVAFYNLVAKHHWKLYSPKDFHDPEGFFQALTPKERASQLEKEVENLISEDPESSKSLASNEEAQRLRNKIVIAEDLVFRKLETELGVNIQRHVGTSDVGIDGLFYMAGKEVIVEIKYTQKGNWPRLARSISAQIEKLNHVQATMPRQLLVVLVSAGIPVSELNKGKEFLYQHFRDRLIQVKVKGYRVEDLKQQYGVDFA